ncbi:related to multidrug resistance protein [Fusarium fujikuroi IMI 58289]|uniref:Related to multidrug resistance protein n=1 Tax=Gibberella fujikuroi (strain CBS 195.34 / IMI 58289 / NRRL A-6831) TaxID=1279085 RepID=S0DLL7_GIBF5|nr:related to multidrug resistance protein [Fusarium fujikuroi IMI 58289]CCT61438.1 related to multidrug resistance protein [Fusarium fujikuroi IMI 58289]
MSSVSACLNDDSLGPAVRGCRGNFDFTVAFEDVVFVIAPATAFICLGLLRTLALCRRRRPIVGASAVQWTKLSLAIGLALLQLALIILGRNSSRFASGRSLAAASLAFIAALLLIPLSWIEHSRAPRPSTAIAAYLSVTLLFDVARTRTAWLLTPSGLDQEYASVLTTATALKALIVYLESRTKEKWLGWDMKQHSPEETSGIWNLGVFFWLNTLFMKGYRVILTLESLYPLDKALEAETHQHLVEKVRNNPYKTQKYGLARLLLQILALQLLPPIIPRAALLAASMCQPFLIHALLHYLQSEEQDQSHGYGLIGATALTYGAIAFSTALYWYFQERFVIKVRGILVLAVYEKTTDLRMPTDGDSGALTLMSTDVERITRGILDLHEYWANTIQIGLSCWLLQRELGAAFAASLGVVAVSTLTAFGIGKLLGPRQKEWMEAIETRVGVTASAISQMKLVKMSGMTKPIQSYVQRLRMREIKIGGRWRMLLAAAATVSQVPMTLSPVITFAVATKALNTTSIFVSISYLTLLASPLMILFQKIPQFLGALTCLQRIQKYLEREPRVEYRNVDNDIMSAASLTPSFTSIASTNGIGIEMQTLEEKGTPHVVIKNGSFGWHENVAVLRHVNITIPTSHLTAIVGPVASGKSTLCKAILGEVPFATGSVVVHRSRVIGYCDQQPFLTNTTIRNNILGNSPFDDKRYTSVIKATMLDRDLANLPQGDSTMIGSSGIALSGGQRQRVAIARALYLADAELLIFDDVLSGLDARTSDHLFRHVFGRDGVLRRHGATVVLCTHNPQHFQAADYAIRISSDGDVTAEKPSGDGTLSNTDLGFASEPAPTEGLASTTDPTSSQASPTVAMTTEEAEARKLGDRSVFSYYIRTIGLIPIAAFVFACVCNGFLNNFPRIWLTFWADDAARPQRGLSQLHSQAYYIGIYGMLQVLALLSFMAAVVLVLGPFIRLSGSVLHQRALETVINAPLQLLTTSDTGTITNYFSQDITIIDNELPMAVANVVLDIFGVVGMGVLIASSSPWLGLTYPAMILILWLIQRFYLRTSRQLRLLDLEAKSPLYTHFLDTSRGIATIRALGWTGKNIKHNHQLLDQSQRPMYLLSMVQRWLYLTLNVVVAVTATALSLSDIVRFYAALETSIGAVARLRNFTTQTGTESVLHGDVKLDRQWPSKGVIEVQGVWAAYNGGDAEEYALQGIHVFIRAGERIALCGRTGSGKSSFILLLLALLEPVQKDNVEYMLSIDGVPLSSISPQNLRERIITVPQDPVFLPIGSTVKENLDPLGVATTEQCREVLQATGLWDMVESQGGLCSILSESSLSQGQRQVFNIARAVIKRKTSGSSVLLLDEFTSSVDADTERDMLAIIEREFAGCTIVMVAHRLHIVSEFCDRVLVLDRGRIVEDGDPRTLARVDESWFASLLAAGG